MNYVPDLDVMGALPDTEESLDGRMADALTSLPHSSITDYNLLKNLVLKKRNH